MADFNVPFASNAGRRNPSADEKQNGFPCGPADQFLFNALFYRIEAELRSVLIEGGVIPGDSSTGQVRDAIQNMIDAATGGGETGSYLLLTQASSRLPIFPEIESADGRINITSPAGGTVRIPGGVDFMHRGISPITTAQTDFATQPSKTYHVRWSPSGGYALKDLTDVAYNPSSLPEANSAFDSKYDDMLMARVVTNASNIATITTLANKSRLVVSTIVNGTDYALSGANGANALFSQTLNWARAPDAKKLGIITLAFLQPNTDSDVNTFDPVGVTRSDPSAVVAAPRALPVTRYGLAAAIMHDFTTQMGAQFTASA